MTYIQVRAKSGLHAGASWVADRSQVIIGSDPNADVFICDTDVPYVLLSLRRFGRRYQIETIHPEAKTNSALSQPGETSLFAGHELTLNFRHIQLDLFVQHGKQGWGSSVSDTYQRLGYAILYGLRNIGAKAIVGFLFLVSLLLTSYVLFFGSVGTVQAEAAQHFAERAAASKGPDVPMVKMGEQLVRNLVAEITAFAEDASIQSLVVSSKADTVSMEGELTRAQMLAFEDKLIRLTKDYGENVDINARLALTPEQKLVDEISVQQLILGSRTVAILRDGQTLYEGGEYKGFKVVSIDSGKVVLQGKSRYEVIL